MKNPDEIKLKWFLIGFLSSQEGWNGEWPFGINDPAESEKTIQEKLRAFLDLLNENSSSANKLLQDFKDLIESERRASNLSSIVAEIWKKLKRGVDLPPP